MNTDMVIKKTILRTIIKNTATAKNMDITMDIATAIMHMNMGTI